MRTSASTVAIVVFSSILSNLNADDDFSALLADLTFTDAPAASAPLAKAPSESLGALKQAPEFALPATVPVTVDLSEMLASGDLETPTPVEAEQEASVPQIALQDPIPSEQPVISTSPVTTEQRSDLNQSFARRTPSLGVPGQVVSHHQRHLATANCGEACDQSVACGPGISCQPRLSVNLPSSTLLQYFRSQPCYTNVWDGYHRDCVHHSHLHGTCDCFQSQCYGECGEVIDCGPANCVRCKGNCD